MADRASAVNSAETFRQFVTAINNHDIDDLTALLAPDHTFIDSLGNRVQGAASMAAGWRSYFKMCPDYWIRTDQVMTEGSAALAVGEAGGTIDGLAWQTPAAWKAVVCDGKLVEWRVFADNKPVYEILASRQR